MGLSHSPRIVTNGLVLCLDAANPKSYPGSGTTWTDMSGLGNHGTLVNGPTFSSNNAGRFTLNGSSQYFSVPSNAAFAFGTGGFTIEAWVYATGTVNGSAIYEGMTSGVGLDFNGGSLAVAHSYVSFLLTDQAEFSLNAWTHVAVSRISTNLTLFKNLQIVASSASSSTNLIQSSLNYIGYTGSTFFPGHISNIKMYNRGLSAAEVSQNFNALRGRYGI